MRTLRHLTLLVCGIYLTGLALYLILRLLFAEQVWWLAFAHNFAPFFFLPLGAMLPLLLILRARRVLTLALPLSLIGALWFGPIFLPRDATAAGASDGQPRLRVVTFNILGNNRQMDKVQDWLRNQEADVIVLQEITRSLTWEGLPGLLDVYPYQFYQSASVRNWGNMVLSRYPLLQAANFDLDDGMMQQRIEIEVGGERVALYHIHLALPIGDEPQDLLQAGLRRVIRGYRYSYLNMMVNYDERLRNEQIARLVRLLEQEPLPHLVVGDFNLSEFAPPYWLLADRLGDAYRSVQQGLGASWPVGEFSGMLRLLPPLVRIDYVWYSRQFRPLRAELGPYLGSDHLPLTVELVLNGSTS